MTSRRRVRSGAFQTNKRASVRPVVGKSCKLFSLAEAYGARGNRKEVGEMDEGKLPEKREYQTEETGLALGRGALR